MLAENIKASPASLIRMSKVRIKTKSEIQNKPKCQHRTYTASDEWAPWNKNPRKPIRTTKEEVLALWNIKHIKMQPTGYNVRLKPTTTKSKSPRHLDKILHFLSALSTQIGLINCNNSRSMAELRYIKRENALRNFFFFKKKQKAATKISIYADLGF